MNKLETLIKDFCKSNTDKTVVDFSLFKKPDDLHKQFGAEYTFNKFKGDILKKLLEELFLGNGYSVQSIKEGDNDDDRYLLVKHFHDNSIRFVLQAKNWEKKIDLHDVKTEHLKFNNNYKGKYNLNNTHFCLVAWSFVKNIKVQLLNKLNIKVWNEQDIIGKLLRSYQSDSTQRPGIFIEYPYNEAKQAVMTLGICSPLEYKNRHKEDPRLPNAPYTYYHKKGWISWTNFFAREILNFRSTYNEAKQAAMTLGQSSRIVSSSKYINKVICRM